MMPVVPHVPPVPPDPPPALLVCAFLRQISPFVITSLQRKEPEAPMPWFLCASTRFSLMFLCSDAEAWVEILVAGFLGLLIADCKLTFLYCSSVQGLEDWTSNGEIQEVVCFLNAAITTMQPFGVQLPAAMCRLQTKKILHLKHGFHVAGSKFHCFKLSQGMEFIICWSESYFFDLCLLVEFNCLRRRSMCLWNQDVMMVLNGPLPLIEDVTSLCLAIWRWWFVSQHSAFSKRTWIVISALGVKATLQKALLSTLSSGNSRLHCLSDSTVFALRLGLVLIEITGFSIIGNLVTFITPLSCSSNLCTVYFAKGDLPKLCSSSTLF